MATALGEYLGGTEDQFARLMTAKAHALGMSRTTFRNANGLPDADQMTTAHDMARLGIALREHFPQYYDYFSTRSFVYDHRRMANHNHLLGRVKGMDGIKTGYTHASGFNLVASVKNDGRSIVAVVMGGRTAHSRDQQMVELVGRYLPKASTRGSGDLIDKAPLVASAIVLPRKDAPTPDFRPSRAAAEPAAAPVIAYAEPASEAGTAGGEASAAGGRSGQERALPSQEVDTVETASTTPSGWVIQVASLGSAQDARDFLSRTDQQGRSDPDARLALHPDLREGRHDLLPRPLRRLRFQDRGLACLQRAQEEGHRLLRGRAVARRAQQDSHLRYVSSRRRVSRDRKAERPWLR